MAASSGGGGVARQFPGRLPIETNAGHCLRDIGSGLHEILWLRRPYASNPLNGEGAYRFGGPWSSPGTRLAYTSEYPVDLLQLTPP